MNIRLRCFRFCAGLLILCQLAVQSSAAGAERAPAPAAPQGLRETLKRAHEMRRDDRGDFLRAIQSVAAHLPEVPVATEPGQAGSVRLQFNAYGQHVDGVRIRLPEGRPRDLVWCFSMPLRQDYVWHIASVEGEMAGGFKGYHSLVDFTPDPDAGVTGVRRRRTVFQFLAAELLQPGAEYVLWFDFRDAEAAEIEIAVACLPAGQVANTHIGIATALGQKRIADALIRSRTSGRHRDWSEANMGRDFVEALKRSEAALAESPEDPNVVLMHHFILYKLKRWKEAEEFGAKRAIPIAERSGDRELLFWVLYNQVHLIWDDDHADRTPGNTNRLKAYNGTALAERARVLAEALDSDNLRYRAVILLAIWVEHSLAGHQWDKAIEYYKEAMAVAQRNAWPDRVARSMGGVAEVLACTGKLDESEEWSRSAGQSPHPFVAARRKQWQPMYDNNKPSMDAYEQMTLREPNERLQREVIGWNERGTYDYFILACMNLGKQDEAIQAAERLHNRTIGMILGAKTQEGKTAVLIRRKATQFQIQSRVEALGKQLALAKHKSDAAGVESAQRDLTVQAAALQQLRADIAADELEVSDAKTPPRMTLKDVHALVPPDAAVLLYFVSWSPFMNEGFIAVVTDKDCRFYPRKGLVIGTYEKQGLQPVIAPYIKAIQTPSPGPDAGELRKANDVLYDLLLKPVAGDIKAHKHLIVIPGGPLVQVPIHLLRDPAGRPLIQNHSVSYVPSFGVLRYSLARNRKVGGEVTVVANPALPAAGASLKFAELEAQEISRIYPGANLLVGDRATEAAVREALTSADVLHFACHGLLDTDFPMKSSLGLTPDDQNDGLLTAREICDYPVSAGLVVLSACESGSGGMSAGWIELVGMTRAWLLAGAPSVVVSLWKLDDRATSQLMAAFYRNLKTMGRAEALQKAQIEMMKRYENPYYWGAFALYGDYR